MAGQVLGQGAGGGHPAHQILWIGDRVQGDHETVEVIMFMVFLAVMVGPPLVDHGGGVGVEAEQHVGVDLAVAGGDDFDRPAKMIGDLAFGRRARRRVQQIDLRQDHQIGAGDLVLEDLLNRVVVVEGVIGRALGRQGVEIAGHLTGGQGRAVDHRDHPVDGHPATDVRPLKRLHQGFGQGQARGFDEDVIDRRAGRQNGFQGRLKIVGNGAANAAIGQFDDIFLGAGVDAAALKDLAVDADIAKFIDDDGEAPAARMGQQITDQSGFPGAQKAGDDGAGNAAGGAHDGSPANGGRRVIRPCFKAAGRPRRVILPLSSIMPAPATNASASSPVKPPKT